MPLSDLLNTWKSIAFAPQWTAPDTDDQYTRFLVPLTMGGIVETGLTLSAGTYANLPDRHVTFELAINGAAGERRTRLIRLDWRSLRGGHSNDRRKCAGHLAGLRLEATHLHSFTANHIEDRDRMKKGKLPCAEPVGEELESFEHVKRFVGIRFRINNIDLVPPPPWVYDLFA